MPGKTRPGSPVRLRKSPRQQRSEETVAVIVEAAARVLESRGFAGFNTNAVAEAAGVSIGSLYQYFPGKHALLSALIEREMQPLLEASGKLAGSGEQAAPRDFRAALRGYIQASVRNQMRRPELARLIDLAERREIFDEQTSRTAARLLLAVEGLLQLPGAPSTPDPHVAAIDLFAIVRALVDAAGERSEGASELLVRRVEGAVLGYLRGST